MPTTSKGLRYPASSNVPNVPQDIQNLASDVDTRLFTNAGMSSQVAGTAPAAGTALKIKTHYGSVVLNANGDGTITYPGGAFTSAVLSLSVSHYSPSVAPSNNLEFVPWNSGLSTVSVRCYFGTATFGSTGVACSLTAIGV